MKGIQVVLTVPKTTKKMVKHITFERFPYGWNVVDISYAAPSNTDTRVENLNQFEHQIFSKFAKNEEQQEFDF